MTRVLTLLVMAAVLACLLGQAWAQDSTADYRTVRPRVGKPFELLAGFETIEPQLDDGSPLPEWVGYGHMILLKDGRLLLAYEASGPCRLSFSSDQGITWTQPRSVAQLPPGSTRSHRPAVVQSAEGDLWLFYNGWTNYDQDDPSASANHVWAIRSRDAGASWSQPRRIFEGYVGMMQGAIVTDNGTLIVPLCDFDQPRKFVSLCALSDDQGMTWQTTARLEVDQPDTPYTPATHVNGGALEPSVAQCPDGTLRMMIRTAFGVLFESTSDDDGKSWSLPRPSALSCGGPCNLASQLDGRLALVWNPADPNHPDTDALGFPIGYGSQSLALSNDSGQTWVKVEHFVKADRIVHSTVTGLNDGRLLITLPGRSTLAVSDAAHLE